MGSLELRLFNWDIFVELVVTTPTPASTRTLAPSLLRVLTLSFASGMDVIRQNISLSPEVVSDCSLS